MLNFLGTLWKRLGSVPEDRPESPRLAVNLDGFVIESRSGRRAIQWVDVSKIETYKVDCLVYDTIVLAFFCQGAATDVCVVPEESAGFSELSAAVEKTFGVDPGWHGDVMLPAFAENRRVLFEGRKPTPAGAG